MGDELWSLLVLGYYVYLILTIVYLLLDNRETSATFAWIFILISFPGFGLLLYLLIGRNRRQSASLKKYQDYVASSLNSSLKKYFQEQERNLKDLGGKTEFPRRKKLFELLYRNSNSLLTTGNQIRFFFSGEDKFSALMDDLRKAERFIHMEYFIWRSDPLTDQIKDILIAKRREGVEVRILYDIIGSFYLKKSYVRDLRKNGVKIYPYDGIGDSISLHSLNYRNHRKIVVIDGVTAYTGGMNMGQEYCDGGKRFACWRDTHMRLAGEAVAIFQSIFATSWYRTTKEDVSGRNYFPEISGTCSYVPLQVTTSGPDSEWSSIEQLYFNLINSAQECICIQSPYFIPSESVYKSLLSAALGGISVRIMITGAPDRRLPYWAAFSFFEPLLRAGVEIYHYQRGFLHAKTIIVDNEICTVGTANMDIRSFQLNYEVNALIYDRDIAQTLSEKFSEDLTFCRQLTPADYNRIGAIFKFRNSIARLFAPIM